MDSLQISLLCSSMKSLLTLGLIVWPGLHHPGQAWQATLQSHLQTSGQPPDACRGQKVPMLGFCSDPKGLGESLHFKGGRRLHPDSFHPKGGGGRQGVQRGLCRGSREGGRGERSARNLLHLLGVSTFARLRRKQAGQRPSLFSSASQEPLGQSGRLRITSTKPLEEAGRPGEIHFLSPTCLANEGPAAANSGDNVQARIASHSRDLLRLQAHGANIGQSSPAMTSSSAWPGRPTSCACPAEGRGRQCLPPCCSSVPPQGGRPRLAERQEAHKRKEQQAKDASTGSRSCNKLRWPHFALTVTAPTTVSHTQG